MRWGAAAVVVLGLFGAAPVSASRPAGGEHATAWVRTTLGEISAHRTNPPRAARALALVSVAMDRAAGHDGRPEAVDAAASTVLSYLFPDSPHPHGSGAAGANTGRRIGDDVVRRARADGSDAAWGGARPIGPGLWEPTPPAFVNPPLEPMAGTWRTWNIGSVARIRPPRPPRFGGARARAETREVYTVGLGLTARQKAIADFWADGAGTVTPAGHWNVIALDLLAGKRRSLWSTTRLLATLNTAQADAFIACWDSKFTYWTERPVTAVRGDIDPSFTPYIVTPPFPSYVSGHATTSAAASGVLSRFFPSRREQLRAAAREAARSRLYGGIHFSTDNEEGLTLGRRVAAAALRHEHH